jgi:hypothetical protein
VHNIVLQCAISHAKSMMKRKGKAVVKVLVAYEKLIKNIKCPRWKKSIKCYYGWKWNMLNTNGHINIVWKGFSMFNGPLHERACWKSFYKHAKTQKMAKSKPKFEEFFLPLTKYSYMNDLVFLLKGLLMQPILQYQKKKLFWS